jgi:5-aminolevulinate synthase
MEALLRKSKAMCPFLKKTSPATLRTLSTTTAQGRSTGGSSMSNLQVRARRCPIMGKALAIQSARSSKLSLNIASGTSFVRAYHAKANRANLHTSTPKDAQAMDVDVGRTDEGV